MTLVGPHGTYTAVKAIGQTRAYTMYLCSLEDGSPAILKVARSPEQCSVLEREAMTLTDLREYARDLEASEPNLGYELCFPKVADSFTAPTQSNRRVVVVSLSHVCTEPHELVPLGHLRTREGVWVDYKTSAWILGRLLKMLTFYHEHGLLVGKITADNVLLHRDKHHVLIFDWTEAAPLAEQIGRADTATAEIAQAAALTIRALGGDPTLGTLPQSDQDPDGRYAALLWSLTQKYLGSARTQHKRFYQTVRSLWPSEKWPFTTIPIEEKEN